MHVPTPTGEMVAPFVPLDVQTIGVVVVNVTASPDDADALTTTAT